MRCARGRPAVRKTSQVSMAEGALLWPWPACSPWLDACLWLPSAGRVLSTLHGTDCTALHLCISPRLQMRRT